MIANLYRAVFRKSSTFFFTAAVGVIFFERTFDMITDGIYDRINKGKQWKDIKGNYQ